MKTRNRFRIIGFLLAIALLIGAFGTFSASASTLDRDYCQCTNRCVNGNVYEECTVCVADPTRCAKETYWVELVKGVLFEQYNADGEYITSHHHSLIYKPIFEAGYHDYFCAYTDEYCPVFDSTGKIFSENCTWKGHVCIICGNSCLHVASALGVCVICNDRIFDCTCTAGCSALSINRECAFCFHDDGYYIHCAANDSSGEGDDDSNIGEPLTPPTLRICKCTEKCTEDNVDTLCRVCGVEGADLGNCNPSGGVRPLPTCTCEFKCVDSYDPTCQLCSMGGLLKPSCSALKCEDCNFVDSTCTLCRYTCLHDDFANGICIVCGHICAHSTYLNGFCTACDTYQPAILNEDGYYEIANAGQLYWFANEVNNGNTAINGKLTADIVVNENVLAEMAKDTPNTEGFRPWTPISNYDSPYIGTFDGDKHTVSGLYFHNEKQYDVGLFGATGKNGIVQNVGMIDSYFCGDRYVGGVVGYNNYGTVQNCYNMGSISGNLCVGGVVGENSRNGTVINCYNTGSVSGGSHVGGVVGRSSLGNSPVINCYNTGSVSGVDYIGGVVGYNDIATIQNCYSTGNVNGTGNRVGGVVGYIPIGTVKNCYYDSTKFNDDAIGATGDSATINNVEGKTTVQFVSGEVAYLLGSAWGMGENGLPVLGATPVTEGYSIYGQKLNIGGDLSMKYYVTAFGNGVSAETLTMEFFFLGKKTEVSGVYDSETGMYVFTLEGVSPQCMGDTIDATLLLNGVKKASKNGYAVEENLNNLLEKYPDDAALVALINDILAYGTAASEYRNHNSMTNDYVGSDREIPETDVALGEAFTGYTVVFGQMNYLKIRVNLAEGQTLYLDGTDVTNQLSGGIFKTRGIAPTDFDKKFSFEIKNGDTDLQTFSVSVHDYISAQKDSATMGELVKALYNYGVSAEVYEHITNGTLIIYGGSFGFDPTAYLAEGYIATYNDADGIWTVTQNN